MDLQKAPVRLIFDGNFENQEVRYDEENKDELHRHTGRNLCGFSPFPQGEGTGGKDAGKLFFPMESLFLHAEFIYTICIIYIYFSVL